MIYDLLSVPAPSPNLSSEEERLRGGTLRVQSYEEKVKCEG